MAGDIVDWMLYTLVILAGFGCGFINTFAGSGSLITLPVLIFLGLPATVANGTNRVGIVVQNLVAADTFRRRRVLDMHGGLLLSVPTVVGSIVGAQIAVSLDELTMRRAIGALMAVMLVVLLVDPERWLRGRIESHRHRPGLPWMLALFAIGVYGGFIQAGVGIFLLAGLVLGVGYDLVRANAVKVLIIFFFTLSALFVFIFNDQVWWGIGLALAVGNGIGGWVAAHMAVRRGARFAHWVLVSVVAVSAVLLLLGGGG